MDKYLPPIRSGLLDFFRTTTGSQFVIPVYQRNYTWTAGKEVKQYLEDLSYALSGEYKNHFLGIIIYLETPIDSFSREFSVIDGQQRLTTTFLILYAIKDLFKEMGDVNSAENVNNQFLINPFSTNIKYKLKPLVTDDNVYQCIVEERISDIQDEDSNVYKNYVYIKNYIKDVISSGRTLNDILGAMNKLYVVCVPISEDDNAQKIFESINATGVKLTASDLIRNFILMDLQSDIQEDYYAKYWKKIEEYISNDAKKLELFFRLFLAVKNSSLPNKSEVYRLFVKWFKGQEKNVEDIFAEIVKYADAYNYVYTRDITSVDSSLRSSIKEFRRILSDMPAPALMQFYILYKENLIDEKQFSEIINIINAYLIRRALCNLDTSAITKLFPSFLKNVLQECDGVYDNIVEIVKKNLILKNAGNAMNMPDDEQMHELIVNANMYNLRSQLRIVFDRLEHEDNSAPVDLSALSVEHLMPQTSSDEWLAALGISEEIYQKNVHRLGNLTLASKSDNSSMGNKVWEYKNTILKNTSHLKINEEILKKEKWSIKDIDDRTNELIDRIIKMYPYPNVNKEIIRREEIFIYDNGEVQAKAFLSLEDGSVEIDTGSKLSRHKTADNFPETEEIIQDLIDDGFIAEIEGVLQFVKPYICYPKFKNSTGLSYAACIVLHGNRNGWHYWSIADGTKVSDVSRIRDNFTYLHKDIENDNVE